jgi:RNA polymerase sigma-70 factor (ECF subfamily)
VERGDADLVQAVLGGDVRAFETLVGRYQRAVYGLAYSVCSDWAAAHDLTQDAFLRAYLELPQLEDPARFAGWLRRIAFRTALNHLRARNARREDLDALDDVQPLLAAPELEDPRVVRETGSAVRAAIESLPSRYRIPLVMHHVRGLAQERVAHFLGVPEGTVKSLLSRARKLLREALEPQIEEGLQMTDEALAGQSLPDDFAETLGALIRACSEGDLAALERLLEEHPTLINARQARHFERSPLHAAAIHGRRPVVELLLRRGASATQRDQGDNAYALHFAAEQGHLEIVKLLVEAGADVQGTGDGHDLEVIGWATCFQHTRRAVAEYLLAHGARHNIFSATALGDVAAIREIVRADRAQLERRLTEHDARRTPLHMAVLKGQCAALETLAELGADLEAKDARGRTPLELALLWRREAVAECLAKLGARPARDGRVVPAFTQVVPILRVKDVCASLDYYKLLGFENGSTWGEPPVWGGCTRDGVGVFFSIHQGHAGNWLALYAENVDALHEQYRARGVRILSAPQSTPWGLREMRVEDPDGNVLRISSEPGYEVAE